MKRRLTRIFGLVLIPLLLLALPRTSGAAIVGFKFFGGYSSMNGGDINEGLKGFVDLYKAEAAASGVITHGDYNAFHGGLYGGGDLIIYFTPIVGIGIGASYIQAQSSSEITFISPLGSSAMKVKPQVTAIPIRAGLYFAVPLGSLINLTLNAGAEYYLAKVKYSVRFDSTGGWDQTEMDVDSRGKIGFCGGIGLEIKIHPNLSILLEGRGRYARLDGFEGKETDTSSSWAPSTEDGKLWYIKLNFGLFGQYPVIGLDQDPPPADPMYQDVRSARLDINGFSALAGIMLRF
jgi:opacity protein-like surface antigen